MAPAPTVEVLILGLSDAGIAAIIGATLSGFGALLAGIAAVLGARNRREIHSPDRNGLTMRDEVIQVERMLGEHIRQTEELIQRTGRNREAIIEWIRRKMSEEE